MEIFKPDDFAAIPIPTPALISKKLPYLNKKE